MQMHKEPCIHCGKDTKKGRFSDNKPIYICDQCYDYHNYSSME